MGNESHDAVLTRLLLLLLLRSCCYCFCCRCGSLEQLLNISGSSHPISPQTMMRTPHPFTPANGRGGAPATDEKTIMGNTRLVSATPVGARGSNRTAGVGWGTTTG